MIRSVLVSCLLLAAPASADDAARDMTGRRELAMQGPSKLDDVPRFRKSTHKRANALAARQPGGAA
jgi:hypothetical protein